MRVLCACECSQSLTSAFIRRGIDAYSCDIEPTFGFHPDKHFQCDLFDIVHDFDAVFAFPPCTHLTYANGDKLAKKLADGRSFSALDFVRRLFDLPNLRMLENPLGIIPKYLKIPFSQIVSPDDFGSDRKKRTCLWLRQLPLLLPTSCRSGKSWIQNMSSSSPKRSYLDHQPAF